MKIEYRQIHTNIVEDYIEIVSQLDFLETMDCVSSTMRFQSNAASLPVAMEKIKYKHIEAIKNILSEILENETIEVLKCEVLK